MRAATKCGFSAWWHWLTCSRTILRVHVWCDTGIGQEHEGEARSSAQQQEANQVGSSIGFGENAMQCTHIGCAYANLRSVFAAGNNVVVEFCFGQLENHTYVLFSGGAIHPSPRLRSESAFWHILAAI